MNLDTDKLGPYGKSFLDTVGYELCNMPADSKVFYDFERASPLHQISKCLINDNLSQSPLMGSMIEYAGVLYDQSQFSESFRSPLWIKPSDNITLVRAKQAEATCEQIIHFSKQMRSVNFSMMQAPEFHEFGIFYSDYIDVIKKMEKYGIHNPRPEIMLMLSRDKQANQPWIEAGINQMWQTYGELNLRYGNMVNGRKVENLPSMPPVQFFLSTPVTQAGIEMLYMRRPNQLGNFVQNKPLMREFWENISSINDPFLAKDHSTAVVYLSQFVPQQNNPLSSRVIPK